MVTPSCIAAMNRAGLAVMRARRARGGCPASRELRDARAARGDEGVLGRDEERVQQEQPRDGEQREEEGHAAPLSGARVLGGWSSSKARLSAAIVAAPGAAASDEHMFYIFRDGVEYREEPCRRPEPRAGHALRLVAEPVHGLRPPLHLLLRPRLRAPRRPARPTTATALDPRQGQRRRGAPRASSRGRRGRAARRDRRRHRPLPARRGALPADPRLHRGARRGREPVQHDHPRPDDRPRHRRPRRGRAARRRLGHLLRPDARRRRLAEDRAGHRAPAPAAEGALAARRRRHRARCRHGADPARHLRPPSSSPKSSRPPATPARRGVWANLLHLRPGHAGALPRQPGARLAGAPARVRAALRGRAYLRAETQAERARSPSSRASTGSAIAGACVWSPSRAGAARAPV